ncbi:MAG: hypothetical protein GYA40_02760 [Chloroflexi bacterium]|nr:hypothetical protein [Chloroflexota bacterium]
MREQGWFALLKASDNPPLSNAIPDLIHKHPNLFIFRNASIENVTEEVTLAHRKMLPVDFPQTCHFLVN